MLQINNLVLLSHPDKKLYEHIYNGLELLKSKLNKININFSNFDNEKIKQCALLSFMFHDIGKATSYFQEYIKNPNYYKGNKANKNHSFISAFVSYKAIKDILQDDLLSLLCFLAIKLHHSSLGDLEEIASYPSEGEKQTLLKQFKSMQNCKDEINQVFNELLSSFGFKYHLDITFTEASFDEIYEEMKKFRRIYKKYISDLGEKDSDIETTFAFQFIFSSILYADKSEAIFSYDVTNIEPDKIKLIAEQIDKYKQTFIVNNDEITESKAKINKIRNEIYNEALNNISSIDLDKEKVLTLTVPTGGGKTLTSLALACRINELTGKKGKIVYSLPFVSLIEQNQDVFSKVLTTNNIDVNDNRNMLSHYYLSDASFYLGDNENYDFDKSSHLIETWNSNLIITTFIQLANTFLSKSNSDLKRFIQLSNSIIILDEVQSFPIEYHKLFSKIIKFLSKIFNIHFIFMSATMPYIFEKGDYKEILSNPEKYYKPINRTKLNFNPKEYDIDEITSNKDIITQYNLNQTSFLFVANTIASSIKIFNYFKRHLNNYVPIYISTNILPLERKKRIEIVKNHLKNKEKIFVVSTQLIEAGVDIDFPLVIRDFAPLDSINQVGGRCNRNGFDEENPYYVICLNSKDKKISKWIYDTLLLTITKNIIEKRNNTISEKDFYQCSKEFFFEVNDKKNQDFKDNWESFCRINFEKFKINLIKDFWKVSVFVELDDNAKNVWKKYVETVKDYRIKTKEDIGIKKQNYAKIKKDFNSYIVAVSEKYTKDLTNVYDDGNLKYLPKYDLERYYDEATGIKRDLDEEGAYML